MIDKDCLWADDFGYQRDMAGTHVPGSLEHEDRPRRWCLSALVPPGRFIPPSSRRAVKRNPSFGADIKDAIAAPGWSIPQEKTRNKTRAPDEA